MPRRKMDEVSKEIRVSKHKARQTLNKYRKEPPVDIERSKEAPVVSEKLALLKRCETCYFCVGTRRVGGANWCHCTYVGGTEDTAKAASWVRSKLNATCWKREELL